MSLVIGESWSRTHAANRHPVLPICPRRSSLTDRRRGKANLRDGISSANSTTAQSEGKIGGQLKEKGLAIHLDREVPKIVSENIEDALVEAFKQLGVSDWNSLSWVAHPDGPAILNHVEPKLKVEPEKLRVTRHVLRKYGNITSATVLFILDEMRKQSATDGRATTGEGLEWGVLCGLGPGITVETVVLHGVPL